MDQGKCAVQVELSANRHFASSTQRLRPLFRFEKSELCSR